VSYALGTNYGYYTVIDEKINERTEEIGTWLTAEERLVQRLEGDVFSEFLSGPGIILTGCDHAVVISSGPTLTGIRGPGLIFTETYERPKHVVDLRVQLRSFEVEAWTKDGIAVRVVTFIPFQMGTGNEKPGLGKGFPYRSSDVYVAVNAEALEVDLSQKTEGARKHEWYDLPQLLGEPIVRDLISRYDLDDLYAPFELYDDFGEHPRARIARELRGRLDEELPRLGIKRIGGGISNLMPMDDRVIEQRIAAWRADWVQKVMRQRAEGQTARIRTVEAAWARAQVDVIMDIAGRAEQLREKGEPVLTDAILLYFVEVLERQIANSALRSALPRDTSEIVQVLRSAVSGQVATGVAGEG
jgi:hypothetical protein